MKLVENFDEYDNEDNKVSIALRFLPLLMQFHDKGNELGFFFRSLQARLFILKVNQFKC